MELWTGELLSSLSLFYVLISLLPYFAWAKCTFHILSLEFVAGIGSLWKCVVKFKGLLTNTFETKYWTTCQS